MDDDGLSGEWSLCWQWGVMPDAASIYTSIGTGQCESDYPLSGTHASDDR